MKKKTLSILTIALLVTGIALFFYKRYHVPPSLDVRAILLTDMNGNEVSLSSYSGKPLFLSFFATWCGPCIRELPELIELKHNLSDRHLQVVCISDEPIDKLQRLQVQAGNDLVFLHAETRLHNIGIFTYPTNYIFSKKGKKVYDKVNPDHWNDSTLIEQIRASIE